MLEDNKKISQNISFKEEDINIDEAKNILDVYFETKDSNYKKWLKEITPFKWDEIKNKFFKLLSYFEIKKILKNNKEAFIYRLSLITWISKSDNTHFYLKLIINWKSKIFFYITRKSIKSKKNIYIDKMISIEKWLGRIAIKKLCDYYNMYNIVVVPSNYWIWFWEKMKKEYKWIINITIQ